MSHLKAFVGHSFTENDEAVVRVFLEYFEEIANMGIGFSWVHAKKAEPIELASKVLGLVEGKNLFIGICTKKERVISPGDLGVGFLNRKMLKASAESFLWKTSDWVIQEIGLCIGRGMNLILLVEDGVRNPGGLQGNIEYINFSREVPERSFGKLLQMIKALLPKVKEVAGEVALQLSSDVEHKEIDNLDDEYLKPKQDWTRRNYEIALMHFVSAKSREDEENISKKFIESGLCANERTEIEWTALREYFHIVLSDDGSMDRMKALVKKHPDCAEVYKYYARGLQHFGEYGKAAEMYCEALEKEDDPERKLKRFCDYLLALVKSGNDCLVSNVLEKAKLFALEVDDGEAILLTCLNEIAEIQGNDIFYVAYLESIVAIRPDDSNLRFKLAYAHSDKGRENLALLHYLKIPYQSRSAVAWNNLGVSHSALNLDALSIEAYRKSEEMGETLAMSNLARKLMGAGFLVEAEELCMRAMAIKEHHKNVDDALYQIKQKKEDEDKEKEKILDSARREHEFYRDFGYAAISSLCQPYEGLLQGVKCQLRVQIKDDIFKAYGNYEQPNFANALVTARLGIKTEEETETIKYSITYSANLTGMAGVGKVTVEQVGKKTGFRGLLETDRSSKDILIIVTDDFSRVRVFEKSTDKNFEFYELNRVV